MDKEELLFQMFKDTVITGTDKKRYDLSKKYPGVNMSKLHRRITNYQVKRYGTSLNTEVANRMEYKGRMLNIKRRSENER